MKRIYSSVPARPGTHARSPEEAWRIFRQVRCSISLLVTPFTPGPTKRQRRAICSVVIPMCAASWGLLFSRWPDAHAPKCALRESIGNAVRMMRIFSNSLPRSYSARPSLALRAPHCETHRSCASTRRQRAVRRPQAQDAE